MTHASTTREYSTHGDFRRNRSCREAMELNAARTQLHHWLENIGTPTHLAVSNLRLINTMNSIGRNSTTTMSYLSERCGEGHAHREQERLVGKVFAL